MSTDQHDTGADLALRPSVISGAELTATISVADALARSGLFKDARSGDLALAKILIGRDLGLSPTEALMGLHVIEGKPELSAALQAAFVKRSPAHDYRVTEHTDEVCAIDFYADGELLGSSRFTMDHARKAGLGGRGPWKSYPRNMLWARAMSNGVAWHCPEVTGGIRVYAEGEIGGPEREVPTASVEVPQPEAQPAPEPVIPDAVELIDQATADTICDLLRAVKAKRSQVAMWLVAVGCENVPAEGSLDPAIASLTPAQAEALHAHIEAAQTPVAA